MRAADRQLAEFVQKSLRKLADASNAGPMAAYMKTSAPFYGVQAQDRRRICREMKTRFTPRDAAEWERRVLTLWTLPHREEKYAALDYAGSWLRYLAPEALPLFERLIREGAWWDLADPAAAGLVSPALLRHRRAVRPVMERWIDSDSVWVRRAAVLSQLKHKGATDEEQLFGFCLRRAHEVEFFIRKAIGWALRDYSWTNPAAVRRFLEMPGGKLSKLSVREGSKRLERAVLAPPGTRCI